MQKSRRERIALSLRTIGFVLPVLYCLLAFLPIPTPLKANLDQSWQYAISRAAAEQFIFGKDIIFTYGPLGYLLAGSPLEQNVLAITAFRLSIYLGIIVIAFIEIQKLNTILKKITLALTVFFALLLGMRTEFIIDYEILFIFFYLLSLDNLVVQSVRLWSLLLGAIAGFAILTKITLGIYTAGSLLLFLSAQLYKSIKSKSEINISIFATFNSLIGALSISFIFLAPAYSLLNLGKVLLCLAVSTIMGTLVVLIRKRFTSKTLLFLKEPISEGKKIIRESVGKTAAWYVFYVAFSVSLSVTILHNSPSLVDYLKNSLQISLGYSSAMSLVGSYRVQVMALSEFILISALLIYVARGRHLGFSLALLFTLWLVFKHGFVRQDLGHSLRFFMWSIIIVLLAIPKIQTSGTKKLSYVLCLYAIVLGLVMSQGAKVYKGLAPRKVVSNISSILHSPTLFAKLEEESASRLASLSLPDGVVNLVSDKKVDVVPWDALLVEANRLNWKPRPIFQSYSAYTISLDNINCESLAEEPRDYIFYSFKSIDGRHPFFDEPKTFFFIFCNYAPSPYASGFLHTEKLKNIILLEKSLHCKCSGEESVRKIEIPWNSLQSIESKKNHLTRAHIRFSYSTLGKIYKTLFRAPPVKISVNYTDGIEKTYRIIPENSNNGVILNPLPRDDTEALSFLRGELSADVKSFKFETSKPFLYKPKIEVSLSSVALR